MKRNVTFGVVGAMDSEVATLRSLLMRDGVSAFTETAYAGLTFYGGGIGGNRVVLVKSGIGKVNAARCTQILIDRYTPDYVVNTGIAGGIGEGLAVGDVVIGAELVQHDFDVTAFGHARGYLCTGVNPKEPTVFRSDKALVEAFRAAASSVLDPVRVKTGRIASGDQFISSPDVKRDLAGTFGAAAAEMEGCAIAQTAAYAGVPFIVIRAISDLADGSAAGSFDALEREAADLSASIIEKLVRTFEA